ncbi:hypothetical protein FSP39_005949 [Pinctada imbricata]|uniref:DNA 3'-5' helicase n=1 Tax=Pinctada imbricata TaxID=66713 RepID=A0AA89C196_PINIB|nr:hypothetical protein FSP39_005949 [Pinctada imbricata]
MAAPSEICRIFSISELKPFQAEVIDNLLNGSDVFLSVKTGAGKSICYQGFQPSWTVHHRSNDCTVLVIAPLISIMKEQTSYLRSVGFKATYIGLDDKEEEDIMQMSHDFLFSSPESILGVQKWRDTVNGPAGERIRLLVIDEAHTVIHWGEADHTDEPFRQWYGKLGELRSILEWPVLLLTATANKSARKKIEYKLGLKNCFYHISNPERENIKLFVQKVKSTLPLEDIFHFILSKLKQHQHKCPRVIIFCTSINTCGQIVTMLRINLGKEMDYVQMFHSKITEDVKDDIRKDMEKEDGHIRVLIATSAAGMGVNFKGLYEVINYGPPKDMDAFVQQFGRVGRDGVQSKALLLYNGKQCKNVDSDMKAYLSNVHLCRRKCLLEAYNAQPSVTVKHMCCDICSKECACGEPECDTLSSPYSENVASQSSDMSETESENSATGSDVDQM